MAIFITVLIVLAISNLGRCLRFAYTSARDLDDGGYPIYGDAVHNGILIGFATILAGESRNWYSQYKPLLACSTVGVVVLNVWLIGHFTRAGERERIRRTDSLSS